MSARTETHTWRGMLRRSVEIGVRLNEIRFDANLHRLSRAAWVSHTLDLARFESVDQLLEARARLDAYPHLKSEVQTRAELWHRNGQDRPGLYAGFGPDGDALAYAEMLAGGFTQGQLSAIAAYGTQELRPNESFGTLNSFAELDALLEELSDELAILDRSICPDVRALDLAWINGQPCIPVDKMAIQITSQDDVRHLGSLVALASQRRCEGVGEAKAA